ncbi:helix-turn-helix domain-containing protein [Microbacterium panaciterrae]|uniref:Helix-turn-helix domain-containing protein n=1 Tax=Microbacterium panaciterrae TaxID=985759 RepID=A0ABP8P9A8_9MICO
MHTRAKEPLDNASPLTFAPDLCAGGMNKRIPPEYLSPREAAERLNVSVDSIRRLIASGTLQAFKFGNPPTHKGRDMRPIRIPVEAVDAALHLMIPGAA